MYIYLLEQNNKIKIGKTINMQQRYKQLSSVWGDFNDNSCFFEFSLSKLKKYSLSIDNIEKTIHRLLKSRGLYLTNLKKKDGYKEFFKKDNTDIRKIIYDNFEDFILEEFDLSDIKNIPEYVDNIEIINNNKNYEIKMHPILIEGRHNWSTNEIKIVVLAISKLNENNKELKLTLSKKEIMENLDIEFAHSKKLDKFSNNLIQKIFEIKTDQNKWRKLTWFKEISYDNGEYDIVFNDLLTTYLLDLKKNFTKYNIQNILPMKSNYSMRIYQLLKQYQKIGSRKFLVEDLKDLLKIPQTYNYGMIKKQVFLKAQEEMKEYSDIYFNFKEVKTGKKITEVIFTIIVKKEHEDIILEEKEENLWYYNQYYGMNIESNGILYENITSIIEKNGILSITFEDEDKLKVKDEEALKSLIR